MLKENKREEITKNIEKREALVEQVADGIWRIGVELPQNPLRVCSAPSPARSNISPSLRQKSTAERPSARWSGRPTAI